MNNNRSGSALVPAMMIVSGLAVLVTAMLSSALDGARTTTSQDEDFRLSSAVESLGGLAVEALWSDYLLEQAGIPGSIASFRAFLENRGIEAVPGDGSPAPGEGVDVLAMLDLPLDQDGDAAFNGTKVDSLRLVRRDDGPGTDLWVTVQTRTDRGAGLSTRPAQRAAQLVWSVAPDEFAGFEFALLANNVNCIFCHTNIDSVERWFNEDPSAYGSFDRIRVGTLETLHIRNGGRSTLGDGDADSTIAGTLYTRGTANIQDGSRITDWSDQSLKSSLFGPDGKLLEDAWGQLTVADFVPAGDPPGAGENLYLDYSQDFEDMVDGVLPQSFPPPFPDDGGIDPDTGEPDPDAIGNRMVDDTEFETLAAAASGTISGGAITVVADGDSIDDLTELGAAYYVGNTPGGLQGSQTGNVMLIGTPENPLVIDDDVVIDGDVVIAGVVKGEGSIVARGNLYVPGDLEYLDGVDESGNRTFGIAQDGQRNALGLAAGGNIMIGDFQRPSTLQPNGQWVTPGQFDIITGNPDTGDKYQDDWSFTLAEMSLFNRGEWAKTQPMLPSSRAEANGDPSTWSAPNPDYVEGYIPRYYSYDEGTIVPLMIDGGQYFDPNKGAWTGGPETAIAWDDYWLEYADPNDPNDPFLFGSDGAAKAVVSTISPTRDWIRDDMYKNVVEYIEATRPFGKPLSIDGLVYTNNSIFSIVNRATPMVGQTIVNGALIAADIGLLAPGFRDPRNYGGNQSAQSDYAIGLQLNYDERVKGMLNVVNPTQVGIRRALWNPSVAVQ